MDPQLCRHRFTPTNFIFLSKSFNPMYVTVMFGPDADRIGLLGKPPACSIRSPSRASSRTYLCSPHANAGMKQHKCGRTQPLFCVGHDCAAEAIFYCPTMNSHRPKSQVTSKEQALNPEKELRRTWTRSHVSLEKSSKNHKPLEKWANLNLSPDVTPRPANIYGEYFPRICHLVKPDPPELSAVLTRHSGWPK